MILPATASLRSIRRRRAIGIAAGIGGALLAATLLLLPANEASAGASDLRFDPAQPEPGGQIHVTYTPASALAAEEVLYLRGAWRKAGDPDPRGVPGAFRVELHPNDDGTYTGSVRMPSEAVFGYFVAENRDATVVDAGDGRFWPILAHEAGAPTGEALREQLQVFDTKDVDFGMRAADMLLAHYADDLVGLNRKLSYELATAVGEDRERVILEFRTKLEELSASLEENPERWSSDAENLWRLALRAQALDVAATWREKLLDADFPVAAQTWLAVELAGPDAADRLDIYERAWMRAGLSDDYVVGRAFSEAKRIGDRDDVLRWGRRHARVRPDEIGTVAVGLAEFPELRNPAKDRLRSDLRKLEARPLARRNLGETLPQLIARDAQLQRELYRTHGQLLFEDGDYAAAIDTLELAVSSGWDFEAFRLLAEAYSETGDASEALHLYAYVLAAQQDPAVRDEIDATLRRRFGSLIPDDAWWTRRVEEARTQIAKHVRRDAGSPIRPAGDPVVRDRSAHEAPLTGLFEGDVTIVVFWSGSPRYLLRDLETSEDVLAGLAASGIRLVTITESEASPDLDEELNEIGLDLPVYYDRDFEAARSLKALGVPYPYVVDQRGRFYYAENMEKAIRLAESLLRLALAA